MREMHLFVMGLPNSFHTWARYRYKMKLNEWMNELRNIAQSLKIVNRSLWWICCFPISSSRSSSIFSSWIKVFLSLWTAWFVHFSLITWFSNYTKDFLNKLLIISMLEICCESRQAVFSDKSTQNVAGIHETLDVNFNIKGVLKPKQWRFCVGKSTYRPTLCGFAASGMQQKVPRRGGLFGSFVVLQETSEWETTVLVWRPTTWRVWDPAQAYTQKESSGYPSVIQLYLSPQITAYTEF